MAKLKFEYEDGIDDNREVSGISLNVPDDMTLQEYKLICMRMASTLGYNPVRIREIFGDEVFGNEKPEELRELIKSVTKPRTN